MKKLMLSTEELKSAGAIYQRILMHYLMAHAGKGLKVLAWSRVSGQPMVKRVLSGDIIFVR